MMTSTSVERRRGRARRAPLAIPTIVCSGLCAVLPLTAASAATSTFGYDAKGRLSTACHIVGDAAQLDRYTLYGADNRTNFSSASTIRDLPAGQRITSADGSFFLAMQEDGNLVLYTSSNVPLWATGTNGSPASLMKFQTDGNLVLYTSSGTPIWATSAFGSCATLAVQNDGNVLIRDVTNSIIWQTNTGGY